MAYTGKSPPEQSEAAEQSECDERVESWEEGKE